MCNEALCHSQDPTGDAKIGKSVIKKWDPLMGRPMSANNNDWSGKSDSPLDLAGFDYATQSYDQWHKSAPTYPSISSETAALPMRAVSSSFCHWIFTVYSSDGPSTRSKSLRRSSRMWQ